MQDVTAVVQVLLRSDMVIGTEMFWIGLCKNNTCSLRVTQLLCSIVEVQDLGYSAIVVVSRWLRHTGLSLAAEKTEALLIARTKKRKYAVFTVEDSKITTAVTLK